MEDIFKKNSSSSLKEPTSEGGNQQIRVSSQQSKDLKHKSLDRPWMDLQEKLLNKSEMPEQKKQRKNKDYQRSLSNSSSNSQSHSTPNVRERSIFVNFQKHLIITLKNNVRVVENHRNDPIVYLATKMWRIFDKSRHYSKKILFFMFGVSPEGHPLKSQDIYQEFKEISTVYPPQEVEMAQEYLREEVIRQSKKILRNNLLDFRRIKHKEQFRGYFQQFLEELDQGWISRRLPKSSKKVIRDNQAQS